MRIAEVILDVTETDNETKYGRKEDGFFVPDANKTYYRTKPTKKPHNWKEIQANNAALKKQGKAGGREQGFALSPAISKTKKKVKEKISKNAGAGEYVKDFRKSDAPQFKGKSKKKKQQMAIGAYCGAKPSNCGPK